MRRTLLIFIFSILPFTANAEGVYAGASFVTTHFDNGISNLVGTRLDERSKGLSLFVGKEFNKKFSLVGFYADLGEMKSHLLI